MAPFLIRRATVEDAPSIAALEQASNPTPWRVDELRATLRQPSTRAFVAESEDARVKGHLVTIGTDEHAEIVLLAVAPESRRQGIARALVMEARAASMVLEVRRDNHPAIALYEALGFQQAHVRKAYYRDGVDALLMVWNAG